MSHIFDALQRSEVEQSGTEQSSFSLATELLQAAEEKMRAASTSASTKASTSTSTKASTSTSTGGDGLPNSFQKSSFLSLDECRSLPVSIPPDSRLVAVGKEESLGAETFRFLAVRLRHLRQSRPLKKVLITSTIPQEGKSTVAMNLACTLARRKQQKTLLLEGDLRRPTVATHFGLGNVPGLSEWFSGETKTINIYRLESLGLWVLPAGAAPQNALELMQSGKLSPLMDQLEAWFDWIVIDSPPVLPLGDTSIWSRMADGILLVTRKGTTEKHQLQRGLETLEKTKLLGALVNNSANAAHNDYYQRYGPATS